MTTNGTAAVLTADFGYRPIGFGSIGDYVWNDANGNGLQDASESRPDQRHRHALRGRQRQRRDRRRATRSSAPPSPTRPAPTTSTTCRSRRYLVDVDQTDAQIPTDAYGNRYVLSGGTDPLAVNLAANQQYTAADFGFGPGGTIGDRVFRDDNGDGGQSANEPGINNVTVQLYRDNDANGVFSAGDTLVATKVTVDRERQRRLLPVHRPDARQLRGARRQHRHRPAEHQLDRPTRTPRSTASTASTCRRPRTSSSPTSACARPTCSATASGTTTTATASRTPTEPGIAGVVVSLYSRPLGSTGGYSLVTTVTTDADGLYTFGNLAAAQYRIDLTHRDRAHRLHPDLREGRRGLRHLQPADGHHHPAGRPDRPDARLRLPPAGAG